MSTKNNRKRKRVLAFIFSGLACGILLFTIFNVLVDTSPSEPTQAKATQQPAVQEVIPETNENTSLIVALKEQNASRVGEVEALKGKLSQQLKEQQEIENKLAAYYEEEANTPLGELKKNIQEKEHLIEEMQFSQKALQHELEKNQTRSGVLEADLNNLKNIEGVDDNELKKRLLEVERQFQEVKAEKARWRLEKRSAQDRFILEKQLLRKEIEEKTASTLSVNEEIRLLTSIKEQQDKKLQEAQALIASLQKQAEDSSSSIDNKKNLVAVLTSENEGLKKQIAKAHEVLANLENQANSYQNQASSLHLIVEEQKKSLESKNMHIAELTTQQAATEKNVGIEQTQILALADEIKKEQFEKEQLFAKNQALKEDVAQLRANEQQLKDLHHSFQEETLSRQSLANEIKKEQFEKEQILAQNQALKEDVAQLRASEKQLKDLQQSFQEETLSRQSLAQALANEKQLKNEQELILENALKENESFKQNIAISDGQQKRLVSDYQQKIDALKQELQTYATVNQEEQTLREQLTSALTNAKELADEKLKNDREFHTLQQNSLEIVQQYQGNQNLLKNLQIENEALQQKLITAYEQLQNNPKAPSQRLTISQEERQYLQQENRKLQEKLKELKTSEESNLHIIDAEEIALLNQEPQTYSNVTRVHLVSEGETLSSIATRYYGNSSKWTDIYNANREAIADKNKIRTGTALVIP